VDADDDLRIFDVYATGAHGASIGVSRHDGVAILQIGRAHV